MEDNKVITHIYSDEELAEQKKQKSRNRVFGILLGLSILFAAIAIFEFVWLVAR